MLQRPARRGAEGFLIGDAEPAGVAEPPSAGDRHHCVNGGVGGLQITVRTIEAHAA